MTFLRSLFNAFKDAAGKGLFTSGILVALFIIFGLLLKTNPLFFWLILILYSCFLVGYFTEMVRSYQSEDPFYPCLSWVLFWMGGKVLVIMLALFLIHVVFAIGYHQAVFNFQQLLIPTWKGLGFFWVYFLLALPFLYQFIATFSFSQLFHLGSILRILLKYLKEFICLIIQLILTFTLETVVLVFLLPLALKIMPINYHFLLGSPSLIPVFFFNLPCVVLGVLLFFYLLILYFTFVKFSLIGQTFARIRQKERALYEAKHPPIRPDATSHFSRHYTFEEPAS